MTHARWLALLFLAGAVVPHGADVARAQGLGRERPERKEYVHFPENGDLSKLLTDKLLEERGWQHLKQLAEKFGDQAKQWNLNEKTLRGLLDKNPQLRQEVEKFKRDKPEEAKALQRALDKKEPSPLDAGKQGNLKQGTVPVPKLDPIPLPKEKGEPAPVFGPPPGEGQAPAPDEAKSDLPEYLVRFAEKVMKSRLGEQLRESPAWQDFLSDMDGFISDHIGSQFRFPGSGWDQLTEHLKLDRALDFSLPEMDWLKVPEFSMPSLPPPSFNVSLPTISFGGPSPAGGLPALNGSDALRTGTGVLWVALGGVLLLILWRLVASSGWLTRRAAAGGWLLGPWPVDPARIATRAELVQAFEHLALLRLGLDARPWNHHEIASRLSPADQDGERRSAAEELAALYEQARYAPADEPLSAPDLDAARRDLCLLAGVAHA